MAKSLNLEEDCFLKECGDRDSMFIRFNYYPSCPIPDHVLGLKPHADGSSITFLLQDQEVEGLQVLKDNQWFKVPIIPDALVINVGDQIEVRNDYYLARFFKLMFWSELVIEFFSRYVKLIGLTGLLNADNEQWNFPESGT